jgi:hypothetical protein
VDRLMTRQVMLQDRTAVALRSQASAARRQCVLSHLRARFDHDEVTRMVDRLMLLLVGLAHQAEVEEQDAYPEAVFSEEFGRRAHALARRAVPLEEPSATGVG